MSALGNPEMKEYESLGLEDSKLYVGTRNKMNFVIYVGIGVVSLLLVLSVSALIICKFRQKKKNQHLDSIIQ
jgi:flagellar biosynthesis/type III secretory pathway M-ring protein FliF/YscJ